MRLKAGGWTTVVVGVIFLIAGLAWGLLGSHQVAYETSQSNVDYHPEFGETSGNLYFQDPSSSDYFIAYSTDFNPPISQDIFNNMDHYTFVARTDTTDPDISLSGTQIDSAHTIEKLTFYAQNGSTLATYTTAEYNANPNGVYMSVWSDAIWLVGIGLLFALLGLIQALRAPRTDFRIGGAVAPQNGFRIGEAAMPPQPIYPPQPVYPPQPGAVPYPPTDPYAQPYQNPTPYPPTNPYAQPYNNPNPYQQPPQG